VELGLLSIVPPLLAIGLAIWTKQVYLSLFAGIWMAWTILSGWNPLSGLALSVDSLVQVFADRDRTMLVMLSVMIGALLTFSQRSGGMAGFIGWLTDRGLAESRRAAGVLAWGLAGVVFVESTIGPLISGAVTRPLFDDLKISREKLAYILDSMCSPKSLMFPLNTFGAYIVGLLVTQGVEEPVSVLVSAVPLNFYAILAVAAALVVALWSRDFGPMAVAERRVREEGKVLRDGAEPLVAPEALAVPVKDGVEPRAINLVLPMVTVVVALPVLLWVTGEGNLMAGSGSVSAFWAVLLGLAVGAVMYMSRGIMSLAEVTDMFMKGVGALTPVGLLLVLAFGIGDASVALGTGPYLARAAEAGMGAALVPAALFVVAGVTAFSTGTSFGTWAIMTPIAIPMADLLGIPPGLALSAVLGGGLFGDHASPISDSTIVASLAASADHIDHVRTQLPYTLVIAGTSLVLYVVFGFAMAGP